MPGLALISRVPKHFVKTIKIMGRNYSIDFKSRTQSGHGVSGHGVRKIRRVDDGETEILDGEDEGEVLLIKGVAGVRMEAC